ncbi:sensor histidine kinase [Posidoniimonas corsicana]|uniref:sensor histidine kinase n=1 Tax=Posidoniimonas corsicana TaxID=1938618 RepID=UPI0018D2FF52|nr:HAMP domain-containing sensor histidine kinase [Posidoniimonas corsicana]
MSRRTAAPLPRRASLGEPSAVRGRRVAAVKPLRVDAPHPAKAPHTSFDDSEFLRAVEHAKLDAMKELAYGASHEINNPLANIAARAQTLLRTERDEANRRMLTAIHRQAMRAHEMISDLMLFARPPRMQKETTDLTALAARVVGEVRPLAEERGILLDLAPAEREIAAEVDPVQIEVAVTAILINAVEALDSGGEIATAVRFTGEGWAELEVADNGPGIPAEVREHLFDPFFSGREAGRGLGFGLSKCWRIVTEHGGRINVQSAPGRGAVITLRLPGAHPMD